MKKKKAHICIIVLNNVCGGESNTTSASTPLELSEERLARYDDFKQLMLLHTDENAHPQKTVLTKPQADMLFLLKWDKRVFIQYVCFTAATARPLASDERKQSQQDFSNYIQILVGCSRFSQNKLYHRMTGLETEADWIMFFKKDDCRILDGDKC